MVWFATGATDAGRSGWPYLVLTVLAAAALSALWGHDEEGFLVVVGLIGTQVVLAGFTADGGDNDGLWLLIFPILAVFGFFLMIPAGLAVWARRRLRARPTERTDGTRGDRASSG